MWCPLEHTTTATPRRAAWWSVAQLAMRAACAGASCAALSGAGARRRGLGACKHGGAGGQTKQGSGLQVGPAEKFRLPMEEPTGSETNILYKYSDQQAGCFHQQAN